MSSAPLGIRQRCPSVRGPSWVLSPSPGTWPMSSPPVWQYRWPRESVSRPRHWVGYGAAAVAVYRSAVGSCRATGVLCSERSVMAPSGCRRRASGRAACAPGQTRYPRGSTKKGASPKSPRPHPDAAWRWPGQRPRRRFVDVEAGYVAGPSSRGGHRGQRRVRRGPERALRRVDPFPSLFLPGSRRLAVADAEPKGVSDDLHR